MDLAEVGPSYSYNRELRSGLAESGFANRF